MEGAAIAQACYLNEVPFVVIRTVSDKVDGSETVDYETFKPSAAASSAAIVRYMLRAAR